jgi:hypothetical protein
MRLTDFEVAEEEGPAEVVLRQAGHPVDTIDELFPCHRHVTDGTGADFPAFLPGYFSGHTSPHFLQQPSQDELSLECSLPCRQIRTTEPSFFIRRTIFSSAITRSLFVEIRLCDLVEAEIRFCFPIDV